MFKRLLLAAAVSTLVMAVWPALTRGQERETPARSRGAFLGIVAEATLEGAEHEGAKITEIAPTSPAAKAGLRRGDIITKAGDRDIHDFEDLANAMSQHKAGDKVKLEVMRNGQRKEMTVTLAQRPSSRFLEEEERGGRSYYGTRRRPTAFLGVQTEELTQEMRNRQGISAREGAAVTEVYPNTPAEQAGLREGDVITKVNDEPITNPEDLREAIQNAGPDRDVTIEVLRGRRHRQLTAHLEEGSVEFNQGYGLFPGDPNREIQRLNQRIQQLERRIRNLEQNRQNPQAK